MLDVDEQKRIYEADTINLPAIRLVLGDVPSPDPARRRSSQPARKPYNRDLAVTIRRIINYVEKMK
jgi:hypothetical protein